MIFVAEESSHLHIRKKRVIDKTRNGELSIQLSMAPYIVNILNARTSHCAGTILESDIIVTSPNCVSENSGTNFTILSGSVMRNGGTPHRIIGRSQHADFNLGILQTIFSL